MKETKPYKLLYAASTQSHLQRFHQPYISALRREVEVHTLSPGSDSEPSIRFDKHYFSLTNLRTMLRIRRILKEEKYDAVILNTTLAAFWIRMAMVGMKNRPYVINLVHGYLFSMTGGMKNRVLYLCERMLRGLTDEIIVMNEEDFAIASKHSLCRGGVTMTRGMGYVMPATLPGRDEALRAQYAPLDGDFLCTFVGELSGRKNQEFLLYAAARLRREGIPVRLLLVGEGAARADLEQLIRKNEWGEFIHLAGNREDVLPFLAMTDLYVSASRMEGLPFNVMEAMACGLPIVASDIKGQRDLLAEHSSSLYPLGDEDAFCSAVKEIYRMGRYGVASVEYPEIGRYSLSAVFEDTLRALRGEKKRKEKIDDTDGDASEENRTVQE